MVRYNLDGTLDRSFAGGRVRMHIGRVDYAYAIAFQSDGKIVVGGYTGISPVTNFALVRYNLDGTLDETFGTGGNVTTDFSGGNDYANAILIQADGRIVVGGSTSSTTAAADFALARYNPDGMLDQSFGTEGRITTNFGDNSSDVANALTLQPDGQIVAAGSSAGNFALARYNPDGKLDESFGSEGRITTDFLGQADAASSVAIQMDGRIIAAGATRATITPTPPTNFALARYTADGVLDQSFGAAGRVITDNPKRHRHPERRACHRCAGGRRHYGGGWFDRCPLRSQWHVGGSLYC